MAFRSNIYEENQLNAYRKAQEAQRQAEEEQRQAYERALQAQNAAAQAPQQRNALESVLAGIGDKLNNAKEGLIDFFGTGGAAVADILSGNIATGKNQNDWKEYRKKTRWNDENMSDKDYYTRTGGTALDTAATLSELIPVVGKGGALVGKMGKGGITALNLAQGGFGGIANPLIQKGSNASLEDVLRGGTVGMAGAAVGEAVGNKLGNMTPATSRLGKIATSNIGRGAITGAASGAVGGGLTSALNGGNLGDVLGSAVQGGYQGGVGGATTAAVMGTVNKMAQKAGNRLKSKNATPAAAATPDVPENVVNKTTPDTTQDIAQKVAQDNAEVATAPNKRNIPITDYDNGDVPIRVRGANQGNRYSLGKGQGSLIDGVLAPDNEIQLPNAQKPTHTIGEYMGVGDNLTDASAALPKMYEEYLSNLPAGMTPKQALDFLTEDLDAPTRAKLSKAIQEAAVMDNLNADEYLNIDKKTDLPKIKRDDYIKATGYSGKDIPEYIRPYLSKNGTPLGDGVWSEYMPRYDDNGTFTGTPDDVLQMYDTIINGTNRSAASAYTPENVGMALGLDSDLNKAITDQYMQAGYPTKKIDVKGAPSIADNIDVADNNLAPIKTTKRILNANKPNTPITYSDTDEPIKIVDTKRNPNLSAKDQAKYERQYITAKKAQGDALLAQYGTIDTPTSRSVRNAGKVLTDLADDYGLETPADVQYIASRLTGKDGLVTQMTRKLAGTAGDIPGTYDEKVLDDLITGEGFSTKERANAVKNQVKQIIGSMNMSGPDTANALDVLDMTKKLYNKRAQVLGEDGTYHRATYDDRATARVLKAVAEDYNDRIWENSDISRALTPENIEVIKSIYPENQKFIQGVDNVIAKATNGRELRSTMANFVKAQDIIDNANQIAGTTGAQMARTGVMRGPVKAVAQTVAQKTLNSEGAQRIKANMAAKKAAQAEAILNNTEVPKGKTNAIKEVAGELYGGAKNIAKKTGQKIGKVVAAANSEMPTGKWADSEPRTRMSWQDVKDLPMINGEAVRRGIVGLNNLVNNQNVMGREISRQAALSQLYNADAARQQQEAQGNYQNALQDYSNASNQVLQAQANTENARAQVGTGSGTGTMDTIAQAMDRALAVGDITSYSKLADLYKQAYSIYQLQNPTAETTTDTTKELTQNQTKALTGLQQLQTLSNMSPTVATALSSTPLNGLVDLFGGDDYYNNAQSLALTLGYLQSGANITPREAEKIGQAYVPTAFDSEAVRQSKLSRAEQLLRNYLGNVSY